MNRHFYKCLFLQIIMLGIIMNFSVWGQEPVLVLPEMDADVCIMGTVIDLETGELLPGARVWLLQDDGKNKGSGNAEAVNGPAFGWQMTDENGFFGFYQGVPYTFTDRLQLFVVAPDYDPIIFALGPEDISPSAPELRLELKRRAE